MEKVLVEVKVYFNYLIYNNVNYEPEVNKSVNFKWNNDNDVVATCETELIKLINFKRHGDNELMERFIAY